MSDPANYAILLGGRRTFYHAPWGRLTVPRDLRDGPAACARIIRKQRRTKALLPFAFMEGGIVLDGDHRRALVFGGTGDVNYDPRVQARLLERLRPRWAEEGWELAWGRRYAYDFVAAVGLPGTTVEEEWHLGRTMASIDELLKCIRADDPDVVLGRRVASGWDLRFASNSPELVVSLLPQLVGDTGRLPPLATLPQPDLGQTTFFLIDGEARVLHIIAPLFLSLSAPHHVAARAQTLLPGWKVSLDVDLGHPARRLGVHGIDLPFPEPKPDLRDDAEVDAIVAQALAYHPEEQVAELEAAVVDELGAKVDAARAKGQKVRISGRLAPKVKASARAQRSPSKKPKGGTGRSASRPDPKRRGK